MSIENSGLQVPHLNYLGVRRTECDQLAVDTKHFLPMTIREHRKCEILQQLPTIQQDHDLMREVSGPPFESNLLKTLALLLLLHK